jgi:hypothetical protein
MTGIDADIPSANSRSVAAGLIAALVAAALGLGAA